MDNFEQNLLHDFSQKAGLSPLVQFRFINDIFFIWTGSKDSLGHFIFITQNCSKSKNMKSKIKCEIYLCTNKVHFLHVTISLKHPSHVLRNIPERQFIRLRSICSRNLDQLLNSEILCKKFRERGFHEKPLENTIKQVAKMDRNELLLEGIRENKDSKMILVNT